MVPRLYSWDHEPVPGIDKDADSRLEGLVEDRVVSAQHMVHVEGAADGNLEVGNNTTFSRSIKARPGRNVLDGHVGRRGVDPRRGDEILQVGQIIEI